MCVYVSFVADCRFCYWISIELRQLSSDLAFTNEKLFDSSNVRSQGTRYVNTSTRADLVHCWFLDTLCFYMRQHIQISVCYIYTQSHMLEHNAACSRYRLHKQSSYEKLDSKQSNL